MKIVLLLYVYQDPAHHEGVAILYPLLPLCHNILPQQPVNQFRTSENRLISPKEVPTWQLHTLIIRETETY